MGDHAKALRRIADFIGTELHDRVLLQSHRALNPQAAANRAVSEITDMLWSVHSRSAELRRIVSTKDVREFIKALERDTALFLHPGAPSADVQDSIVRHAERVRDWADVAYSVERSGPAAGNGEAGDASPGGAVNGIGRGSIGSSPSGVPIGGSFRPSPLQVDCLRSIRRWQLGEVEFCPLDGAVRPYKPEAHQPVGISTIEADLLGEDAPSRDAIAGAVAELVARGYLESRHRTYWVLAGPPFINLRGLRVRFQTEHKVLEKLRSRGNPLAVAYRVVDHEGNRLLSRWDRDSHENHFWVTREGLGLLDAAAILDRSPALMAAGLTGDSASATEIADEEFVLEVAWEVDALIAGHATRGLRIRELAARGQLEPEDSVSIERAAFRLSRLHDWWLGLGHQKRADVPPILDWPDKVYEPERAGEWHGAAWGECGSGPKGELHNCLARVRAELLACADEPEAAPMSDGNGAGDSPKTWKPPLGFVGVKTILRDARYRKKGKNPSRSTIQAWEKPAAPDQRERDPASGEIYYSEEWVNNRWEKWNPRT